jgi:hypothetical protein
MKPAKRLGVILMALGFLASLFGCSKTVDHGSWTSLVVSNLSPDRRDSYSFRVNVLESGEMILIGYCNDDENEYRSDDGIVLSSQTADKLRAMELEKLSTYSLKRKTWPFKAADDVERIAQIAYEDGTEFAIFLSNEQRTEIVSLLEGELVAALSVEVHGEWDRLWLSFRNDNYSEWYDFEVSRNERGEWIAKGYCSDEEYNRRESEDGIILSPDTMEAIREMKPERYAAVRKSDPDPEFEDAIVLDGSSGGLTLGYADGYTVKKATPWEVDHAISALLKKEFAQKADKQ